MATTESERQAAHSRYATELETFKQAAATMHHALEDLRLSLGVRGEVEAREKSVPGFAKKAYLKRNKYSDPWLEITDKVGARLIVETSADLVRVRKQFESDNPPFVVIELQDKSEDAEADELYYPGVHVQVEVPGLLDSDAKPIECEIQLRTKAQDLWSVPNHKLVYKAALPPTKKTERRISRLSVLVEMFDEEVDRAMEECSGDPAYADAVLLRAIEEQYLTFVAEPGSDQLSLEVLGALSGVTSSDGEYLEHLHSFVVANREKLALMYKDYGVYSAFAAQWRYWLFGQPESLVVLHLVESQPLALMESVADTDLRAPVEEAFAVWGLNPPTVN